jgi:hypothetical protein
MAPSSTNPSSSKYLNPRDLFRDHPIQSVLGVWGSILAVTGLYLRKREIPFQLKVIQARIVAQWGLVFCATGFALLSLTAEKKSEPVSSTWKVRSTFDLPEGSAISAAPAMGANSLSEIKKRERVQREHEESLKTGLLK